MWINLHSAVEFIIACTGGMTQTRDLGRSNRKIVFSPCQAKSCVLQCSRFFNLLIFSRLNHCISWHTLSKYQSVRKLQVLSAACSLPADLIPLFHLRLPPSEMELCHLLGHKSRIKKWLPKTRKQHRRKIGAFIYFFTKALRTVRGLCHAKTHSAGKGMHIKKRQMESSLVNMLARCIIVLKYIYFIFHFKYMIEFQYWLGIQTYLNLFQRCEFNIFFPEVIVSCLAFPVVMNPQQRKFYGKIFLFD